MNLSKKIKTFLINLVSSIFLWALIITICIIYFLPDFFEKYQAKLSYIEQNNSIIYYDDITNDNKIEKIVLLDYFGNNYVEIFDENNVNLVQIFISKPFHSNNCIWTNDFDNDNFKEIYFFTISNDSLLLNAISGKTLNFLFQNKFITTVGKSEINTYDAASSNYLPFNDLNKDDYKEMYFYLSASFSYYPRGVYAYDIHNDTLYSSEIVGNYLSVFNFHNIGNEKLLLLSTWATNNYSEQYAHIPYPDTTNCLIVLKENLEYLFPPIVLEGRSGSLYPFLFSSNNNYYIGIFFKNYTKEQKTNKLALYDLNGNLVREKYISPKKNINSLSLWFYSKEYKNQIQMIDNEGYMYILDENLNIVNDYSFLNLKHNELMDFAEFDIDSDNEVENIFIHDKGFEIFRSDFSNRTSLLLENPCFKFPSIVKKEKNSTLIQSQSSKTNIWFVFEYKKNKYFAFKWLFYLGIYIVIYLILFLSMQLRVMKLKSDNKKLQKIIDENTRDLINKNEQLLQQKEEILAQTDKLFVQNKRLLELDRFKEEMTGMIVHDLKNPLNYIINQNQNSKIAHIGRQMLVMVTNILDIQKFETTNYLLNSENHILNETLYNAVKQVEYLLEEKKLILMNFLNSQIRAKYDNDLIERVFINLLTNATKYSPFNEQIIIKSSILDENNGTFVKISISNNGPVIPNEFKNRIFDKFSQADAKNLGISRSTGLGLTFCKFAIEAHKGKIGVESCEGKGSEFWFTLPLVSFSETFDKNNELQNYTQNAFVFTTDDKEYLQKFGNQLKKSEFYEFTILKKIMLEIDENQSNAVATWKKEIQKAIDNFNQDEYYKLIDILYE